MIIGETHIIPPFFIVISVVALIFLMVFFRFVPLGLWISAWSSGAKVGIFSLIGMRLRRVTPARIVLPLIKLTKANIPISHFTA